jgi:hypothetical protein
MGFMEIVFLHLKNKNSQLYSSFPFSEDSLSHDIQVLSMDSGFISAQSKSESEAHFEIKAFQTMKFKINLTILISSKFNFVGYCFV